MPGLRETLEAATPGGWRVQGWDDEERCWFVLGGGPEFSAAEHGVAAALVQPTETVDSPRAIANARLIALAPELAAAHFETLDDIRALAEGEEHLAERAQAAGDMEGVLIHRSAAGALRQIERTLLTRLDAIGKPEGRNDGKEAE